jgi:hypothetical protein
VREGRQRLREHLQQVVAQAVQQPPLVAARPLVVPRQRPQRRRLGAARAQRPVAVAVREQDPGEQLRVRRVALRAGRARPGAIALHRPGVEGVDRVPGRQQGLDQEAVGPFERDQHRLGLGLLLGHRGPQPPQPGGAVRHPQPPAHRPGGVHEADGVLRLGPVDPQQQHGLALPRGARAPRAAAVLVVQRSRRGVLADRRPAAGPPGAALYS